MVTFFILFIFNALVLGIFIIWGRNKINEAADREKLLRPISNEIESMLTQINKSSLDAVTLMEDKISHLRNEMTEADRRITMLDAVESRKEQNTYEHLNPGPVSLNLNAPRDERSEIVSLKKEGLTPEAIASRVGTTVGEVEMILSLDGDNR